MKIFEIEDYIVYLEHSEPKYFLAISHINGLSLYEIINTSELYARLKTSHLLDSTFRLIEDIAIFNSGLKLLKR